MVLSACLVGTAFAGGHKSGEHRGQDFFPSHKMAKVLELSDAQKEQFKALKEEMKANRPEKGGDKPIKAQLAQLDQNDSNYEQSLNELAEMHADRAKSQFLKMADMRIKIKQILTAEQLEKFNAMAKKRNKGQHKA
jgi:protein CpxP